MPKWCMEVGCPGTSGARAADPKPRYSVERAAQKPALPTTHPQAPACHTQAPVQVRVTQS